MGEMTDDRCVICRTGYRDASARVARRLLCERGDENACPRPT